LIAGLYAELVPVQFQTANDIPELQQLTTLIDYSAAPVACLS